MKDREPQAPRPAEVGDEDGGHGERAQPFEEEGPPEDEPEDLHEAAELRRGHRFLQGAPLHEAHPPPGIHGDHHGEGHHAHAAGLDEEENHELAEEGPVRARVHRDEPGDAHRGHRREERVHHARAAVRRKRQEKQRRPRKDRRRKTHRDDLKGRQSPLRHTGLHLDF